MANSVVRDSQPGLEVNYQEAPIVADPTPEQYTPASPYYDQGKQTSVYNQYNGYKPPGDTYAPETPVEEPPKKNRLKWVIIGVVGLVLVIVAGVIGGVIGSKMKGDQQQTEGNSNSDGKNATATIPASTQIRANSQLAATGYRFGTDYGIQVFYQGPEDKLRYSVYQSNFEVWAPPQDINAAAIAGTPMGAGQLMLSLDAALPPSHQTEFFFISAPNQLNGQNWRDGFDLAGLPDSIGQYRISISSDTQIGAYWPSIIMQDSDGTLQEVIYNYTDARFSGPNALPMEGSPSSPILALPREANHSAGTQTVASSMRIIYRDTNGQLVAYDRDSTGSQAPTSGSLPTKIDQNAAIGGFATARSGTVGAVNTWVLYQTTNGSIEYVYQDDGTGWKGPKTDPVLEGADKPTHISCVTAAAMGAPKVPLTSSNDISHCFFQSGKALKQVQFDGTKWRNLGFLPIP